MPSSRLLSSVAPCPGAAARAQAWLDGALGDAELAEARAHAAACTRCADVLAVERRFREFIASRAPRPLAPATLRLRVRAALGTAERALAGRT